MIVPGGSELLKFAFGGWAQVISSNVAEACYDRAYETLYIGFHGGRPQDGIDYYAYPGVPWKMASAFIEAHSQGKWIWTHLRGRDGGHLWPYVLMEKNKTPRRKRK